jgi:hypothetical protein
VAAFGLSGCSHDSTSAPAPSTPAAIAAPAAPSQSAALPEPAALIDVLNRLADPAVPGTDKLNLVEGSTPDDAATLDNFTEALQDTRMLPLTFNVTDLAWSADDPRSITASVTATPSDPAVRMFSFPMSFTPAQGGWQLSRETAVLLLALGSSEQASAASSAVPSSATAPTPTG